MSKPCWENGAGGLAQRRVATNLQFVGGEKKAAISVKHHKKEVHWSLAHRAALDKYFWMKGSLSYYLETGWPLRIPLPIKSDMHGL